MNKPRQDRRAVLQGKRDELAARLERIERDRRRRTNPLDRDWHDAVVDKENDEVLDRLSEATEAELRQVEHALQRYDEGTCGVCETCARTIGRRRLAASPEATQCGRCARRKPA
ncbi:MAG: TraR/DksA family transcriptional regulator [Nevskia sp.]|nr:TraR/DksA family transcriptional regulator [Nevskia sp.]